MKSTSIGYRAVAAAALGIFAALAASSCAVEPSREPADITGDDPVEAIDTSASPIVEEPADSSGRACPRGWSDPRQNRIDCARGLHLEVDYFRGLACVQCARGGSGRECRGPWVSNESRLSCDPSEHVVYQGACQRCGTRAEDGYCQSDADCVRTGCSGQLCSDQPEVTSCEWRAEYACYSQPFARCSCQAGLCGWAPDRALGRCLESPPIN